MSLGSWLLLFFSFFSIAHFYLWLPERYDYLKIIPAIRSNKFLSRFRGDNLTKIRGLWQDLEFRFPSEWESIQASFWER